MNGGSVTLVSDLTRQIIDVRALEQDVSVITYVDVGAIPDARLLAECGENPEYFAEFYRRHSRAVLTFLMRRTDCAQTAADLSSETFAAALVSRRSFRGDTGTALPWLYGIARNHLGKYFRRERVGRRHQKKLAMRPAQLSDDDLIRVEELADMDSLRGRIVSAMQALPAGQADAVQLRVIEEREYDEVASMLGVSEGAARVRVSRGLTRLAEMLEDLR